MLEDIMCVPVTAGVSAMFKKDSSDDGLISIYNVAKIE